MEGAVINGNFAIANNMTISEETILLEDKDPSYANIIAVADGNANDERIQKLVKALQSDKIKKFIEEKYIGSVIPAF